MPTDLQTIESYWSLEEAEIAKGFLASEGIRCELDGSALAGNFWHLNVATGGVKLRTLQQDADRATALLHGIEHHSQDDSQEDAEDFWQDDDQTTEDDGDLDRTSPQVETEDSDSYVSGGLLQVLRSQKWIIILSFILLIVCGVL